MRKEWHKMNNYFLMTKCPYMKKRPNGFYSPCGNCYYCRKKRANELAFRCQEEAFDMYVYNCLLTYDDEHLPIVKTPDGFDVSLNKVHFQDFMKRLRYHIYEKFGIRLRYLCVGEYGGKKGRPHYHMILFSPVKLSSFDLDKDDCGHYEPFYFLNTLLTDTWRKGAADAEEMHNVAGSVKYMVQYLLSTYDERSHVEKPFRLMSRGKGLGYKWLERNEEFLRYCVVNDKYVVNTGSYYIAVPRYYQQKFVPEYLRIARADDYYYSGQEYENYLKNLNHHEKREFINEFRDYKERERETSREAYRKAKIHDNGRSAVRFFARSAKDRKR